MKKQLIVLPIAVMISGAVFAAGAPVTNQFSAGQPAIAADVNANFQELADRIDGNNTNISTSTTDISSNTAEINTNIADIAANSANIQANTTSLSAMGVSIPNIKDIIVNQNLLTREFKNLDPTYSEIYDVRKDTFVFDTANKQFNHTIVFENATEQTQSYIYEWDYNTDLVAGSSSMESMSGATSVTEYTYTPGYRILKDKVRVGESWGSYMKTTSINTFDGVVGDEAVTEGFAKYTIIGYQDVTVAAGEFKDCVLIEKLNPNRTLYFYCRGPGLTRVVSFDSDIKTIFDWQLQEYTTQ